MSWLKGCNGPEKTSPPLILAQVALELFENSLSALTAVVLEPLGVSSPWMVSRGFVCFAFNGGGGGTPPLFSSPRPPLPSSLRTKRRLCLKNRTPLHLDPFAFPVLFLDYGPLPKQVCTVHISAELPTLGNSLGDSEVSPSGGSIRLIPCGVLR